MLINRLIRHSLLLTHYNFSTIRPKHSHSSRANDLALIGKLATKDTIEGVLHLFHLNNNTFNLEQIALACRVIAKNIHLQKNRDRFYSNNTLLFFKNAVEESVEDMNPIQLLDVLYLLRKQKLSDLELFELSVPMINKVNGFVAGGAYSLRNLISLFYSMEVLNINTYSVLTSIHNKIFLFQTPETIKDITFSTVSEFLTAISHRKLILTSFQKTLILKMLQMLQTNCRDKPDLPSVLNIIYGLSKVYISNLKSFPFVKEFLKSFQESFENISGGDILKLIAMGRETKYQSLTRLCKEIKKGVLSLVNQNVFEFEFVMKVLREVYEWNDSSLSRQEEAELIEYFQKNQMLFRLYDFNRHIPRFLKLFQFENAKTISHLMLQGTKQPNLFLLVILSQYVNVTQFIIKDQTLTNRAGIPLADLLKLAHIFHNTSNLPVVLSQFNDQIPSLVSKKLDFTESTLKNFMKQSPPQLQKTLNSVFINKLIQIPDKEFLQLFQMNQFIFSLINFLTPNDNSTIQHEKLIQTQLMSKLKSPYLQSLLKMNYKHIIAMFGESRFNTVYKFWNFANLIKLSDKKVIESLHIKLIHKTLLDTQHLQYFILWLHSVFTHSQVLDPSFIEFLFMILDYSNSKSLNKFIIQSITHNLHKLAKMGHSRSYHLTKIIKREGYLSEQVQQFFGQRFKKLASEPLSFLSSFKTQKQIASVINKNENINFLTLEYILLYQSKHWVHLKHRIVKYLRNQNILLEGWNRVVTSLRPHKYSNDEVYLEVVGIVCQRIWEFFQKQGQKRNSREILGIVFQALCLNPPSSKQEYLTTILTRLEQSCNTEETEGLLNCLWALNENKLKHILKQKDGRRVIATNLIQYLWVFPFEIEEKVIEIVVQALRSPTLSQKEKGSLAMVLMGHDYFSEASNFLNLNKSLIDSFELHGIFKEYYSLAYSSNNNTVEVSGTAIDNLKRIQDMIRKGTGNKQRNSDSSERQSKEWIFITNPSMFHTD